jgi:hypothetical protein
MAPQTHHAPAPLVAPDVDLRDFPYVPLYRQRLFASRFNHLASDAEFRAGFLLWLASWDQIPAGSLPNDDRELCQLAGLGRDMRQWRKVKRWAMHNWQLCDDARLYHPVVAEMVNNALAVKQANRHRTEAARGARWQISDRSATDSVTDSVTDENFPPSLASLPRKGKGKGNSLSSPERVESQSPPRARNGHDKPEKINDAGPLGRSAPLARSARPGGLKATKKDLLAQKLMRFALATMNADERQAAFIGLLGEDAEHPAQWWFDHLDLTMRKAKWDDTF